jgi:predicted secreted Zn-dependent protease
MSACTSASEDLDWRVSRTCDTGACVGVARRGNAVYIRNTNDPEGPISTFTAEEWRQFLAGVKLGDFDEIA